MPGHSQARRQAAVRCWPCWASGRRSVTLQLPGYHHWNLHLGHLEGPPGSASGKQVVFSLWNLGWVGRRTALWREAVPRGAGSQRKSSAPAFLRRKNCRKKPRVWRQSRRRDSCKAALRSWLSAVLLDGSGQRLMRLVSYESCRWRLACLRKRLVWRDGGSGLWSLSSRAGGGSDDTGGRKASRPGAY